MVYSWTIHGYEFQESRVAHLHILTEALPMWFKLRSSPENSSTFVHVLSLIGIYILHVLYIIQLFSSYFFYFI